MNADTSDVIIAGAGLTGCTLAGLLARGGITCTLVDSSVHTQRERAGQCDPRALSITPATERILSAINVWQQLASDKIGRFETIHVWDENSSGAITFKCEEICEPVLGYIIEQSELQRALDQQIALFQDVKIINNAEISAYEIKNDRVVCHLSNGRSHEAKILVGADGINSSIRNLAGLAVERYDYHQKAVACIVKTAIPHERKARQRFLSSGPVAFLPMYSSDQCGVVWSTSVEKAEKLLNMEDRMFCRSLEDVFELTPGEIVECQTRVGFTLHRSRALNYITERVVLVGDAAHTVHPLAGLGANMGIADVATLSQLMINANHQHKDIAARSILRRYERWRKTENRKIALVLEGIKNIFEVENELVRNIRCGGMKIIQGSSFIKDRIMKNAMGLTGDVPSLINESLLREV